jgi:polyhydroxyalkanoate synthesis regulator protein
LEKAKAKNALLPVPLLHLIIQYGENILSEFFEKYLEQTIKNYLAYKSAVDDQYKKWLDLGTDMSKIAKETFAGSTGLEAIFDQFSYSKDTSDSEPNVK